MRVMTMDGGFRSLRGLGALSSERRIGAEEGLLSRVEDFYQVHERFEDRYSTGQLPAYLVGPLDEQYQAIDNDLLAHQTALDEVDSEAALRQWQRESSQLISRAQQWARQVRQVLGESESGRGLRIFLLAAASVAVLGGTAYWVAHTWEPR